MEHARQRGSGAAARACRAPHERHARDPIEEATGPVSRPALRPHSRGGTLRSAMLIRSGKGRTQRA